ncbi:MAG: thiol-disulfide oxidoreductase DCC family protein [Pseudomonadota bacterium]
MSEKETFEAKAIWLFDSVCVLCDGAVQYTLDHEKAPTIRFVSVQSEEGQGIARDHGIDPDNADTFLFIENGEALARSDGVIALSRHLTGLFSLLKFGWLVPRFLRDFAYDLVARNRYRLFGKRTACRSVSQETRARFVLQEAA